MIDIPLVCARITAQFFTPPNCTKFQGDAVNWNLSPTIFSWPERHKKTFYAYYNTINGT